MNLSGSIAPIADLMKVQNYNAGTHLAAPGANTAFFSTDLTAPALTTRISVTVQCAAASVFSAFRTSGPNVALKLNSGTALTAHCLYTFVFGARQGETYNFQIDNAGNVEELTVEANYGGI